MCDTNPVPPSEAVLADPTADAPAAQDAAAPVRALRGDLDTIVAKAMHKDPARRYTSPARLADDLRRHLEGRPVHARPDTPSYRFAKFVRRNKAGVALAAALVLGRRSSARPPPCGRRARPHDSARSRRSASGTSGASPRPSCSTCTTAIAAPAGSDPRPSAPLSHLGGEYLDRLVAESGDDPALLRELAEAYDRLGDMQGNPAMANLGNDVAALESYRKALAIREDLVQRGAFSGLDASLDVSFVRIGDELVESGAPADAGREYIRALAMREDASRAQPPLTRPCSARCSTS